MQRRTAELYRAMFRRMKELIPTLETSLEIVVTDFERGLLQALAVEFPRARRVGCEFHYLQVKMRQQNR